MQVFIRTNILRTLTVAFASALLLWAQAETGQIVGTIADPSGATITDAKVRVVSTLNGSERNLSASSAGSFTVANLLPGEYSVAVDSPGFSSFKQTVLVRVGAATGIDVKLQVGQASTTVEVVEQAAQVNTETQTLSTTVSEKEIRELPTLTRNPYALVALSGNASDAGAGNRGVGFSINGQRQASTNVLLDGAANNDEFAAGVGQQVPLDSVEEFSILTNNFTAEFGRAGGGVVNVVTKAGTNSFHGTAYEFNRVSSLSSNSFDNNANSIAKSIFTRNQFGYSAGGPVIKNKLFFFSSTEWLRTRSPAQLTAVVPTSDFLALTAPGVQDFFATAKLKSSDAVLATYSAANTPGLCGKSAGCASFVAAHPTLPIFQKISYLTNSDAGGGAPINQYDNVDRVDYNLSDKTQIYARYALESDHYLDGYASASPYQGYDTGQTDFNNNMLVSVVHTFTPSFVSQSKAVFNRLNELQPFGAAGGLVPTLFTGTTGAAQINNSSILFPGYNPATPGGSIPFGGPQNFVQLYQDFSWTKGKHTIRFGGSFDYQRDNRSFGAYEDGAYYMASGTGSSGAAIGAMVSGIAYEFQAAIYPQGQLPGATVNLPLTSPNFSRSNRYKEGAVYVQDAWKIVPRFNMNIGLRWEHFGVQHNKNPLLDSNFYDPADQIDTPLGIRQGQASLVPKSSQGSAWKPDYHDFAPRLGFAWDLTGDGKTSLRGGYGMGYERNFGNVTFNMIQNPPNYETVQILSSSFGPINISPANFGPLSGTTGNITLPRASLRNVDYNIQTAYSHFWSATLERQVGNNVAVGVDYSGSRGVHLYDIAILNQPGFGNVFLGDPCSYDAGDCTSYLNNQYSGINRRGSRGWSNYNAMNFHAKINDINHSGLSMTIAYTWSHALDNLSSTFSDADGFSNNNGQFNTGYLDPYNPMLDKGSSDFDIRHRVSIGGIWDLPILKHSHSLTSKIVGGWELAPLFTARSGSPYSLFDSTNADYNIPRAALNGPLAAGSNSNPTANGAPNSYDYLTVPASLVDSFTNPLYYYSNLPPFPSNMTGRNTFRAPGFWELDLGAYKSFAITERVRLQLRGEAFNMFNHANLYVVGTTADLANLSGDSYSVTACRGCTGTTADRRNLQLAIKLIF